MKVRSWKMMHIPVAAMIVVSMAAAATAGAEDIQRIPVSATVQQTMVQEYTKKILEQNSVLFPEKSGASQANPYENEGHQLASQLQIVSDNEEVNYSIMDGDTLTVSYKDRD